MTAEELVADFGAAIGLRGLRLDAQGCARLMIGGKTAVNFEHDAQAGCLHLYVVLGPVPAHDTEGELRHLLEANLFGARTGGASFAIDTQHNELVLCRQMAVDHASGAALASAVDKLVNVAEEWQPRMGATPAGHAASATPEPEAMPGGMWRA